MADLTGYITQNGVIVPDTADLQSGVQTEFQNALGLDLDVSPETPQGRLIEAETLARKGVLDSNAMTANAINPATSFGTFLDALSALTGTQRMPATYTTALCTLTGTPGTVVPIGSLARTQAGDVFALSSSATIGADGTAQAYFTAQQAGAVPCEIGTLTQIVTPVLGWETVNNPSAAVLGSEQESDASLRLRRQQELYKGEALLEAIKSAVERVNGVLSLYAYENYTNATETIDGITINPHSIFVVADGGADEDVARAIWENKSLGCGYTGDVEVTVLGAFDTPYLVKFSRPDYQPIQMAVTVSAPSMTQNTKQSVKDALSAWANGQIAGVDGLKLGTAVSPFEAAAAISAQIPGLFVSQVQVGLVNGGLSTDVLSLKVNEKATLAQDNITVTVQ